MPGKAGRSGRTPKPTSQLKREGGYVPSRHANRGDVIPVEGAPVKPSGLTAPQNHLWQAVASHLPAECLGTIDTAALTELVSVYGLMLDTKAQLAADPTDKEARIAYSAYFDRWFRLAGEFGLTPIARARLQRPLPNDHEEGSAFTELLARMQSCC